MRSIQRRAIDDIRRVAVPGDRRRRLRDRDGSGGRAIGVVVAAVAAGHREIGRAHIHRSAAATVGDHGRQAVRACAAAGVGAAVIDSAAAGRCRHRLDLADRVGAVDQRDIEGVQVRAAHTRTDRACAGRRTRRNGVVRAGQIARVGAADHAGRWRVCRAVIGTGTASRGRRHRLSVHGLRKRSARAPGVSGRGCRTAVFGRDAMRAAGDRKVRYRAGPGVSAEGYG